MIVKKNCIHVSSQIILNVISPCVDMLCHIIRFNIVSRTAKRHQTPKLFKLS